MVNTSNQQRQADNTGEQTGKKGNALKFNYKYFREVIQGKTAYYFFQDGKGNRFFYTPHKIAVDGKTGYQSGILKMKDMKLEIESLRLHAHKKDAIERALKFYKEWIISYPGSFNSPRTTSSGEFNPNNFEAKFKIFYDKEKGDTTHLDISINDKLKELLNKVCIKNLDKVEYRCGNSNRQRFRVKTDIYSLLPFKTNILFDEELVLKGVMCITCADSVLLYGEIREIRKSLDSLIKIVVKAFDSQIKIPEAN